ncbi:MAG: hypothetical protein HRU12_10070 [Phaeodactylibacter sp.]|nr:hypothetical protein [Phaeodactylibacter sp.]
MSHNLKLDTATHDIIINRGAIRVGGAAYVAQLTKTKLSLFFSEWELDETLGIDWYNIMGSNYDLSIIQGIVSQSIRDTKGVEDLTTLTLDLNKVTRKLSIDFTAIANGEVFTETIII